MEAIIDTRINKTVNFHDVLHLFITVRVMVTDIMELKLIPDLGSVDQDLIFLVFTDLKKSYENLDLGQILNTLEGYREEKKWWACWRSSGHSRIRSPNIMGTMVPSLERPAEPNKGG